MKTNNPVSKELLPGNTVARLMAVGKLIRGKFDAELTCSYSQIEALRFLESAPETTMRVVARHFKITAPSATSLADELVRARYAERIFNPTDRREVMLRLTSLGKKTYRSLAEKKTRIVAKVLSPLAETEQLQLDRILDKIIQEN